MKYFNFLSKEIKPHKDIWILLIFILIFILLRIPSLVEPYWYGDEGIYQVIGKAINSGKILYLDIWDNKPPLLYYIYAIFNGDQFWVRMLSLIVGVMSVVAFYTLGKLILKSRKSIFVATSIFVFFFGSPIIEGNIANAENFMLLPIMVAGILILKFKDNRQKAYLFIAGLLLSVAFSIKVVAVFELFAFLLFLIATNKFISQYKFRIISNYKKVSKEAFLILGFLALPIFFSVYFIVIGAFPDFLSGVLSENIDYVGVGNELFFPMGVLLLKSFIAFILVLFLFVKKKSFSDIDLFLYFWLIMALFSTFFSQRPFMHYILMTLVPLAYFVSSIVEENKKRIGLGIVSIFILMLIYYNFGIYKKTFLYYENYISFTLFGKNIIDYQSFFDSNTPRDYEIARFIGSLPEVDDVFVWTDSGQIYSLSDTFPPGKYIVAYHITFYNNALSYMVDQVENKQPKYIISTKESPELAEFLKFYTLKYRIANSDIYERQN